MPTKPVKKKTNTEKTTETTKTVSKTIVKKPEVSAETAEPETMTTPPVDTRLNPAPETAPEITTHPLVTTTQPPAAAAESADSASETDTSTPASPITEAIEPATNAAPPAEGDTDDDVFGEESSGGSGTKYFLIFLAALIIGALIVGGYFYYQSQTPSDQSSETEQKGPEPTLQEPEATDEATMTEDKEGTEDETGDGDLAEYTIQILNGSGIAGQAGAVQELLETEGFEQFDTGNADSFDFTDTEARMKEEVPASVFTSIMESLEDYTVVEGDVLDEDADYDIVITVGQKK
ncbi:MAG: coiled-coil [Microgenomates group bacterium GW2011_GWC1_41_8]|uniref:LytR/CpsA/Psr regulator C-terminal domain-containing protein n=2 Tax=Candidatus Roizmaniibacteriota TaxID=1752723 RepID=A0A0G0VL74_9BACT|nr:MAG: hypothetical protein UU14_C0003G0003 [Candidatus Roizmanbacteria bacterium GW2011_GWB1_40_7]KKR94726.1 MAG: hypothetical protein UU41_C0004G0026 [Candidatus Roizmanbacteria bacterium GW2011_GWA1_41_13]KKS24709.1 MAG: coiled-coil [Microgenomates group bacterium GW2011_GWC1_41_8]OGK50038.1 MAG: hypothetical protein A3A55_03695 [Candidatus Roizmanbacteria bacterium RIFCSPLOWO2_01_FULL_40_14]